MADRSRIQELLSRYAWGHDQGDLEVLGDCLTEAAVLLIAESGSDTVGPFEGKANVLEYLKEDIESRSGQYRHLVSNVFLEEDGNAAAVVVSYSTVVCVRDGRAAIVATSWIRDRVAFDGGKWRICERRLTFDTVYGHRSEVL